MKSRISTNVTAAMVVTASVLLSGCSFYLTDLLHDSPKSANNGFRYLNTDADRLKFAVDPEHSNFNFNEKYYIQNENINPDDAMVGKQIDITAPIQILDSIPGSVSTLKNNVAVMSVDTYESGYENYDNILWDKFLNYLKTNNIGIEKIDSLNNTLSTGWFSVDVNFNRITPKMLADNDDLEEYRVKYDVAIKSVPEKHIVQMAAALTNFKVYHQGDRIYADPDSFVQSRYSSLFLNDFISSLHGGSAATGDSGVTVAHTGYITASLGRDKNGQYAWIINADYETVWSRFIKMLPACGFEVLLNEKTRGIVDVDYDEPSDSFFTNNGIDNYVIEDDKYRFQVGIENGKTVITIFNNLKQPLSDDLFLKMYSGFARSIELEFNK